MKKILFFLLVGILFFIYQSWYQLIDKELMEKAFIYYFSPDWNLKIQGNVKRPSWGKMFIPRLFLNREKSFNAELNEFRFIWDYPKLWNKVLQFSLRANFSSNFKLKRNGGNLEGQCQAVISLNWKTKKVFLKGTISLKKMALDLPIPVLKNYLQFPFKIDFNLIMEQGKTIKINKLSISGEKLKLKITGKLKKSYFSGNLKISQPFPLSKNIKSQKIF